MVEYSGVRKIIIEIYVELVFFGIDFENGTLTKKSGKSESAPIYHQTKLQYLMPLKILCTLNV